MAVLSDTEELLDMESEARAEAEAELVRVRALLHATQTELAWREREAEVEPELRRADIEAAEARGRADGETALYRVLVATTEAVADPDRLPGVSTMNHADALSRCVVVVTGLRLAARHAATAQEADVYGDIAAQMAARIQHAFDRAVHEAGLAERLHAALALDPAEDTAPAEGVAV